MKSESYSYDQRIEVLRQAKLRQAEEKRKMLGPMDYDEWGIILPPEKDRKIIETISASGVLTKDAVFNFIKMETNHSDGDFYGARLVGRNYRTILENHPVYIDPMSSLAGAYMTNFYAYRKTTWNPDYSFSHLEADQKQYGIIHGIGGTQHLCQDNEIGLRLGFGGLLKKVRRYKEINAGKNDDFYTALEDILLGQMNWISRTAKEAQRLVGNEPNAEIRKNLEEISAMNFFLVENPPRTFREACQFLLWIQLMLRMYNGSGSMGRLDLQLLPYYENDKKEGILTDDEAVFHIACLLLRDTAYIQLGGYDRDGHDDTNTVSYLALEALHEMKSPANVGVAVADDIDEDLLRRGVEIIIGDKLGYPKFLGLKNTSEGFARNGYPVEDGRQRVYSGCHWHAIPGREYSHMDLMKINLPKVFIVAFNDMMQSEDGDKNIYALWVKFALHLKRCVDCVKAGCDIHRKHMKDVFPELAMDLFCYGPVEKGVDASADSLDYYCYGVDAAGLATVADSFAALDRRVEKERRLTWDEIAILLKNNWQGENGELYRRMMRNCPRFGQGNSSADDYAKQVADLFTSLVISEPTPGGITMLPGIFGWASIIDMGKEVGATPDGRFAEEPISHGANPSHGFRADNAPTALLKAVAKVQPARGNTVPAQLDVDPMISGSEDGVNIVEGLIKSHFHDGGTQINLNIMNNEEVLDAYKNPEQYPDLVVRVTGFSAYFASLSPEMRKFVVDRIINEKSVF